MLFSRAVLVIAFVLSLVACGGGGGGSSNSASSAAPVPTMLSGQVLVPNGMVASLAQPSVADTVLDLLFPAAMADLTGISPAPAGTTVELVRLNSTAAVSSILATTTTDSSGGYSFNLDDFGVAPDITLAVQIRSGIDTPLRAIVTTAGVDITPESEFVFRDIVAAIQNGTPLANITIEEVATLVRALRNLSGVDGGMVSGDIETTIANLNNISSSNVDYVEFRTAALAAGRIADGSRINSYVPLQQGVRYGYIGFVTANVGEQSVSFSYNNGTTTNGNKNVSGVTTTRFSSSNYLGIGSLDIFRANTLSGSMDYTDVESKSSNVPIPTLLLPYVENQVVSTIVLLDEDITEVTYRSFPLTSLSVPFGSFNDIAHTRVTQLTPATNEEVTIDFYYAPDIGLIRQDVFIRDANGDTLFAVEELSTLSGLNIPSFIDELEISVELNQEFQANVFEYSANVAFNVDTISVSVAAIAPDTEVTLNGSSNTLRFGELREISLLEGDNRIEIELASSNRRLSATYVIIVTREEIPPLLSSLDVSSNLDQIFQEDQFNYTASVGFMVNSLDVMAAGINTSDNVRINSQLVGPSDSVRVSLDEGDNSIQIVVSDDANSSIYTVFVVRETADIFAQQAYIKASNSGSGHEFGASTAIDGNTLVVGAPLESSIDSRSGAVYVFDRNNGVWSESAVLKASNVGSGDNFGISVALDGNVLAVGAIGEDSNSTGVNGDVDNNDLLLSGAAYVFRRTDGVWNQEAYIKASNSGANDRFGERVSVYGDTLAVAAVGERSNAAGVNGDQANNDFQSAGAVYVFTRENEQWGQQAYIKASNPQFNGKFGASIDLDAGTLAVGATGTTGSGAAYVFVRNNGAWAQQAYIKGSNTDQFDDFGVSIALDGDTLAVGAIFESSNATGVNGDQTNNTALFSGAAYVFVRSNDSWSQQAYIKSSNSEESDRFSIALALDGDLLAVGATFEDSSARGINGDQNNNDAFGSGAVYVFQRANDLWRQTTYIKASNADENDVFGSSLALDNGTLISASTREQSNATGINGDETDNLGIRIGAVYVFK